MDKLILILALVLLSGCQSSQVDLTHKFEQSSLQYSGSRACEFNLGEYQNLTAKGTLGVVAGTQVNIDVDMWAKQALNRANIRYNEHGLRYMKVTLVKSYIHSVHTSMVANVVFKVEYRPEQHSELQQPRYFRGKAVKVNWLSGEGELFAILHEAMDLAVAKIVGHYRQFC